MAKWFKKIFLIALIAFLVLNAFHVISVPKNVSQAFEEPEARELPLLAAFSLARMSVAYALALVFAIVYGYYAAFSKWKKALLAILDVLQSIPILGFFPAVIFILINSFNGSMLGLEIAAVLLIFTSMAWNMTFGVYDAIKSIPSELIETNASFAVHGYLRLKRLVLPALVPKLVYNSMVSWTNGWYFLIASEIISFSGQTFQLRGLGSFLANTITQGRLDLNILALVFLVLIVTALELLLWRPLQSWSNKFKYETIGTGESATAYRKYLWMPVAHWFKAEATRAFEELLSFTQKAVIKPVKEFSETKAGEIAFKGIKILLLAIFLFTTAKIIYAAIEFTLAVFSKPLPAEAFTLPFDLLYSALRIFAAYLITSAWTIPAAVFTATHPLAKKYLIPLFEVVASIPATALFPLIVLLVIKYTGSIDLAAVILLLTGMQWYLFFNLVAGAASIPEDLILVAKSFGLKNWLYWKRVILPAITPSFIIGSITAWGGAWNALIIAEYVTFNNKVYAVEYGLGKTLDQAVYVKPDATVMALALALMVMAIILLNTFFWRKVYEKAIKKYRLEY